MEDAIYICRSKHMNDDNVNFLLIIYVTCVVKGMETKQPLFNLEQ